MKTLFAMLLFSLFALSTSAQTEATTKDGRNVILNNDGTWQYHEAKSKSVIVEGDCSTYTQVHVDKMTGQSTITGPPDAIVLTTDNESGLGLRWLLIDKTVILAIKVAGEGCIDDNGIVNILFTDGSRAQMQHQSGFNCDGKVSIFFGGMYGKKRELEQLENKTIATIRVATRKTFVQEDLPMEDAEVLRQSLVCLKSRI